jgi:hypothetical protein
MSFQDKSIQCSECGIIFTFTAGQQKFFASKRLTNEPRRCPQCRKSRKPQRHGPGPSDSWASYANKAMLSGEYQKV